MRIIEIDKERFFCAKERARAERGQSQGIGTLGEKLLHSTLKYYFEPEREYHEIKHRGYVAGIMRDGRITEIQTAGIYKLREKLCAYLSDADVTVVCPLAMEKRIYVIDKASGAVSGPRLSPKRSGELDLISMLVGFEEYISTGRLTVLCVCLSVDEYRERAPKGKYRPRATVKIEGVPTDILRITEFRNAEDYLAALPTELSEVFTVKDLAKIMKRKSRYAQSVITLLLRLGVICRVGNSGRAYLYSKKA